MKEKYGSLVGRILHEELERSSNEYRKGLTKQDACLSYCPECGREVFWKLVRRTNKKDEYRLLCLQSVFYPIGNPPEVHVKDFYPNGRPEYKAKE